MVLELGLKLTRAVDESGSTNLQIAKDRTGSVFVSSETDKLFILNAHLQGYRKGNIKIEINEDGTCIAISGEKTVQETIIIGWQVQKKGVETQRFRKAFKIPDGVILDKIEAKFNEDESELTITMPKKVRGIHGKGIEEVKEQGNLARQGSGTLRIADDEGSKGETLLQRKDKEPEAIADEESPEARDIYHEKKELSQIIEENDHQETKRDQLTQNEETQNVTSRTKTPSIGDQEMNRDIQEKSKSKYDRGDSSSSKQKDDQHEQHNGNPVKGNGDHENGKEREEGEFRKRAEEEVPERRGIICAPIVAGSAILLSLVAFVFHLMRSKNQPGKRKD